MKSKVYDRVAEIFLIQSQSHRHGEAPSKTTSRKVKAADRKVETRLYPEGITENSGEALRSIVPLENFVESLRDERRINEATEARPIPRSPEAAWESSFLETTSGFCVSRPTRKRSSPPSNKLTPLYRQSHRAHQTWIWRLAVTISLSIAVQSTLSAQVQAEPKLPDGVGAPAGQPFVVPLVRIGNGQRDWVESWIFNGQTGSNARLQLDAMAEQRLSYVESHVSLDEVLREKLELAARLDIQRFFREVEQLRSELQGLRPDRSNMQDLSQKISPLQLTWNQGLTNADSLFIRTINSQLSADQKKSLVDEQGRMSDERLQFHIANFVRTIEKTLPLSESQRTQFIEILERGISKQSVHRSVEHYLPIHATLNASNDKFEGFLDAQQLAVLSQLKDHWRKNVPSIDEINRIPVVRSSQDWLAEIR